VVNGVLGGAAGGNVNLVIALCGITKLFVGELIETGVVLAPAMWRCVLLPAG
jgi:hypothetical protein